MNLTLRPATPADRDLLSRIYASTREEEIALTDWTQPQIDAFLTQQFTAQDTHYRAHYPGAVFNLILLDDEPIGRLYLHRRPAEIRIMDIALLPPYRNRGLGTTLLRTLQTEAASAAKSLTIHVEQFNPALRLYTRLGFHPIAEHGVYLLMEWRPTTSVAYSPLSSGVRGEGTGG
ncbi:MAG TPA: GNAT family N-acetyltransferase [Thermomicrobiales bacterium]|nr:GNAT family N-acetyltransferase [Thermomicrobiales bacterium]